jgi:hypothetical protein
MHDVYMPIGLSGTPVLSNLNPNFLCHDGQARHASMLLMRSELKRGCILRPLLSKVIDSLWCVAIFNQQEGRIIDIVDHTTTGMR